VKLESFQDIYHNGQSFNIFGFTIIDFELMFSRFRNRAEDESSLYISTQITVSAAYVFSDTREERVKIFTLVVFLLHALL